jgi:predicted AAA+ superfamily ATPase
MDLLRLLAFQVGREVSLNELGQQIGADHKTVARYLDLFEKTFVLGQHFPVDRQENATSRSFGNCCSSSNCIVHTAAANG